MRAQGCYYGGYRMVARHDKKKRRGGKKAIIISIGRRCRFRYRPRGPHARANVRDYRVNAKMKVCDDFIFGRCDNFSLAEKVLINGMQILAPEHSIEGAVATALLR